MKSNVTQSSFSGELVNYYEMFFLENRGTTITQEVEYLIECVKEHKLSMKSIMDVGCGTGYHVNLLAQYAERVFGLDISNDMIQYAKKNHLKANTTFICDDIRKVYFPEEFDVAFALSHVIGYQLDNDSVEKMLININKSLKMNGLLLLNFYNESAILLNKLKPMRKKVKDDNVNIVRFSNAEIIANENALSLEYLYFIIDSQKDKEGYPITIEVNEKMRYFTQLELNYYFNKAGFKVLNYYNYMTKNILLEHEWNGLVIVEKFESI